MEKYCISVDWLQVCCYCNYLEEKEYRGQVFTYNLCLNPCETAMFKRLYSVKRNGLEIATIQACPRPKTLNKDLVLLKINNRVLYCEKYIAILYDIMNCMHMVYKGITRLDLCHDCNYFHGHKSPSKFIHNFIFKNLGETGFIYRKGSTSFTCHGSKGQSSNSKITSISFGSNNSKIRQYIYDKSIELQEVKDKPWIRDYWEQNGLINDEKTHVWRSEISIKSQGMDILNMSTGELFRLSPKYLDHIESIEKMFFFYANRYLCFHICRGQKRTRDYPVLQLFEYDKNKITCKPVSLNTCHDTGRMEKICLNKLEKLQETYVDLGEQYRYGLQTATEFLQMLSGMKSDRARLESQTKQLNRLRAFKFLDVETQTYLQAVHDAYQNKKEICSTVLYNEYVDSLNQTCL